MYLSVLSKAVTRVAIVASLGMSGWIMAQSGTDTVLKPADLEKLFPATVYYSGQSAPAQLRNSGGVKFSDGHFVLASMVDNSGYSTGIKEKYQAYLITEVPLNIGGKHLPAGAFGIGFLSNNEFVITDLGGNDVLTARSIADRAMSRPRPLQITTDPAGGFRLYAGRNYVQFNR